MNGSAMLKQRVYFIALLIGLLCVSCSSGVDNSQATNPTEEQIKRAVQQASQENVRLKLLFRHAPPRFDNFRAGLGSQDDLVIPFETTFMAEKSAELATRPSNVTWPSEASLSRAKDGKWYLKKVQVGSGFDLTVADLEPLIEVK
jgi:hypothetical protein